MSPAFDEYAFNPDVEIGAVSQPIKDDTVQTKGGYWLVKVAGIEDNKELADDDLNLLTGKALNDWAVALWANPDNVIENYLDSEKQSWAYQRAFSDVSG
jgi:hypothetical protein